MLLRYLMERDDGLKNQISGHLNLDLLKAVSTTKGCYVGQEVYSSYIHHVCILCRSEPKKHHPTRVVPLVLSTYTHKNPIQMTTDNACNDIPSSHLLHEVSGIAPGTEIHSNGKTIGQILHVQPR